MAIEPPVVTRFKQNAEFVLLMAPSWQSSGSI